MDIYKLHFDLFNTDLTFTNVILDSSGYGFWIENLGTPFNLYEWVRTNIYLPHLSDGTSYTSDWTSIITWIPPNENPNNIRYDTQIRFSYNPTSSLRGVVGISLRHRTYDGYTTPQNIYYSFTGNEEEAKKYLNILLYDTTTYYRGWVVVGSYQNVNFNEAPYLVVADYINLNACLYPNETLASRPNTHTSPSVASITGKGMETTTNFYNLIEGVEISENPDNQDSNYSGPSGGNGTVDDRSDYIPSDGVPTISALSSGFLQVYNPTKSQIVSLYSFMISDGFLENVKKLIANPIDYIISLHLLPVTPTTSGSESIKVGGIDTQVSMSIVISQYLEIDCGTLNCNEYWGSFIDYSPFTKVSIYLPFVGIKELNLDDVMSSQIKVLYRIDVLTGNFVCSLHIISSRKVNAILYNYSGNMSMSIPISATDYRQKVSAFTQLIGSGTMVGMTGGTSPSTVGGFVSSMIDTALSKHGYSRSGTITGDSSLLGNYVPYLIISRPNQSLPSKYKGLNGYTSNIGGTVGKFSGYNEFREVKTDGLTCLEEEKQMIVDLLQGGVFV